MVTLNLAKDYFYFLYCKKKSVSDSITNYFNLEGQIAANT